MNTHLLEQIATPESLLSAWRSVRGNIPKYRRQRAVGPDGVSLTDFEQDLQAQNAAAGSGCWRSCPSGIG
jgi:hypothetical protein